MVTILDSSSFTVSAQVDERNQYLSIKQATLIADVRKDNELNLFCKSRQYLSIKQATLIADVRKDNELNLFCKK